MNGVFRRIVMRLSSKLCGNSQGKIVFYHDVFRTDSMCNTATKMTLFKGQMESAFRSGWRCVGTTPFEDRTFQVCFDDGFRGLYECRDELIRLSIRPTVNLIVTKIGEPGYLNEKEILELKAIGFKFQSHTWSHAWLPECDDLHLKHELADSKKWLEDLLQDSVDEICFPRGLFSRRVCDAAVEAGYRAMMSCIPGGVKECLIKGLFPRQLVQAVGPEEFVDLLNGAMRPFRGRYIKRQFRKEG